MTSSVVDYENLMSNSCSDANTTVRSRVRPRWERKQQKMQRSAKKAMRTISLTENNNNHNNTNRDNSIECVNGADRYISNRATLDIDKSCHFLRSTSCNESFDSENSNPASCDSSTASEDSGSSLYKSALRSTLLGIDDNKSHRVLSFKEKAPAPKGDIVNHLKILYSASGNNNGLNSGSKMIHRHIPSAPTKVLDAPEVMDDYYLNLISWSESNFLAIALSQQVYIWNASSGDVQQLCTFDSGPDAHVSSVSWIQKGGPHLAVGTSDGSTQLWDAQAGRMLRSMDGHSQRVGALSWNNHILSSGGKDSLIVNHDVRVARHQVSVLSDHSQEVCGLAWSPDGTALASGANDNKLCIWDASTTSLSSPRFSLTDHQAAVKALAWSPHERNLLASGGGTADRCMKFWNTQTGALLNSIDAGSQVSSLVWNPHEKEILSSHGFERNQLTLWNYPSMVKVKELEGHTARVLHMKVSPDGESVVSCAADETLRFWNVFSGTGISSKSKREVVNSKNKFSRTMHLR